jgi:outer membrane protein
MFRITSVFSLVLAFSAVAPAQSKVAIVNFQKAIGDTDEMKKITASVEAKFKPRQDELNKLQADLQSIDQQINSGKLNQNAVAELQVQGQRKQRDAQRLSEDLQSEFDRERQDVLSKAAEKMQKIVAKLAEEKGLDFVIDTTQAIYFKPAMDITTDVVAAYNKANPAK